jgi:hypothetical protein
MTQQLESLFQSMVSSRKLTHAVVAERWRMSGGKYLVGHGPWVCQSGQWAESVCGLVGRCVPVWLLYLSTFG